MTRGEKLFLRFLKNFDEDLYGIFTRAVNPSIFLNGRRSGIDEYPLRLRDIVSSRTRLALLTQHETAKDEIETRITVKVPFTSFFRQWILFIVRNEGEIIEEMAKQHFGNDIKYVLPKTRKHWYSIFKTPITIQEHINSTKRFCELFNQCWVEDDSYVIRSRIRSKYNAFHTSLIKYFSYDKEREEIEKAKELAKKRKQDFISEVVKQYSSGVRAKKRGGRNKWKNR